MFYVYFTSLSMFVLQPYSLVTNELQTHVCILPKPVSAKTVICRFKLEEEARGTILWDFSSSYFSQACLSSSYFSQSCFSPIPPLPRSLIPFNLPLLRVKTPTQMDVAPTHAKNQILGKSGEKGVYVVEQFMSMLMIIESCC